MISTKRHHRKLRVIALMIFLLETAAAASAVDPEIYQAVENQQFETALQQLIEFTAGHELDADGWYQLARVYLAQGENKQAEKAIEKALTLAGDNADYHCLAGEIYTARVQEVGLFKRLSYAYKIRDAFQQAIAANEQHVRGHLGLVQYYVNAPGIAGGDIDKAKSTAEHLAKFKPAAAELAYALIAAREEDLDAAFRHLEQAWTIDPANIEAIYYTALMYMQQEKYEEAVKACRTVLAINAGNLVEKRFQGACQYQLGKAASESGQWLDEGEQALLGYIQRPTHQRPTYQGLPSRAWAYYRLALIQQKRQEADSAKQYFSLAKAENRGDKNLKKLLEGK